MKGRYTAVLIVSVLVTHWLRERFGGEGVRMGCPPLREKNHKTCTECNEGESLDTAYSPTGFSAFMRPLANMYLCRTMCLRIHHLDVHYKVANGTTHTLTHVGMLSVAES